MTAPQIRPDSWAECEIDEIFASLADGRTLHQGWSPQCEAYPSPSDEIWGALKTTAIQPCSFHSEHNKRLPEKLASRPSLEVKAGDILITCAGPRARCGIACLVRVVRPRLMISGKMYRFRVPERYIDPRFIEYFLQTSEAQAAIDRMKTGGSDSGLNLTHERFRHLKVLLAPSNEQIRIVQEIEKQFTRLDAAILALKRVQANLERYRAAVLKAAFEGRLVPTEAELARREGRSYEPASALLEHILAERRLRSQADRQDKSNIEQKPSVGPEMKRKYKEPEYPCSSQLGALPEGWTWASVEQLSVLVTDGDHNPPKRLENGMPHLTAKNVRGMKLTLDDCTFISLKDAQRVFKRYRPLEGDLIVTCVGTVGRTAIVPKGFEFSPDRNLAAIRCSPAEPLVRFLQLFLEAPNTQSILLSASGSTAQPHLYLGDLRKLLVPLPPLIEQHRIVTAVEDQLSVVEHVASEVVGKLKTAGALRQAILKSAFEGKLVRQEPNDEPATLIIERIRAEQKTEPQPSTKTRRRQKALHTS